MQYFEAVCHPFRGEKWFENLLLVSVCMLIPFIGPILVIGYCAYGIAASRDQPFAPWPRFNFDRFSDYLATGLWPFLVSLTISAVMMPFLFLVMAPPFLAISIFGQESEMALILGIAAAIVVYLVILALYMLVAMPMILRSALEQNFHSAFSLRYLRGYLSRVWMEIIATQFFIMLISIPLMLIGYMMCFIGIYPAIAVSMLAQWHLKGQIHSLYLERGGEPVPIAETLLVKPAEAKSNPAPPPPELPSRS